MPLPSDPIERLEQAARELRDVEDWDEPTGRTDVHVHVDRVSQVDIEPTATPKAKVKWALGAIGAGVGTGIVLSLATLAQRCSGH